MLKNGFFIGDIEDEIYKNMMVEVFKLNVYSEFLNSLKKDYIIMIIKKVLILFMS